MLRTWSCFACLLVFAWRCQPAGQNTAPGFPAAAPAEIRAALLATTADWNQGDLEGFMSLYDSAATFMTSQGLIGLPRLKARYQQSYFRGTQPRQQLRFSDLEVRPLGANYALVTGKFSLAGGQEAPQSGRFSLVFHQTKSGWKILHDHSS